MRDQPLPIEQYALIGDMRTAALVGLDGSIDWLCVPRFDAGACFAALLGQPSHGRFWLSPVDRVLEVERRYRPESLVLETTLRTQGGAARLIDFMPPEETAPTVVRIVEGLEGEVRMHLQLIIRFDYGWVVPWVRRVGADLLAVGGPDALTFRSPLRTHGEGLTTVADFVAHAGEKIPLVLSWHPSVDQAPAPLDAMLALQHADAFWAEWASRCTYRGPYRDAVVRSLLTLKALTYTPTGGLVAAPTTSLPEQLGGTRNWDYRYCWLRDATFTLHALLLAGYRDEARAWRDWLLRAVAGAPSQLQIMYGLAGERRLPEMRLPWLPGYQGSAPVRVGNAAVNQLQLDVYGEVMDVLHNTRRMGLAPDPHSWGVQHHLLEFLESSWREPDEGLWEVRGPRQHFTHSKVMAWVAFDRAVKAVERLGFEGPVDRWRALRDQSHREICERGFDPVKQAFTQAYGSHTLDASLLMLPLLGFLPASDPRIEGTVRAIERELISDGLVLRYRTEQTDDGLPTGEGVFLLCSFWLADNLALMGRQAEARALFERLLSLRNDVGLLSEEYDPVSRRLVGNFPQAFSHVGLVNTAFNLSSQRLGPAVERKTG